MSRTSLPWAAVVGVVALAAASGALAQEKQMYRYIDADGKVVYTDKTPPPSAKSVQPKRMNANVIESNDLPIAAQIASEKYPVTLYTFDCGDVCRNAEALLNRRGVPYSTVNVSDAQGGAKLQALTGTSAAPVLQVGEKWIAKGFLESQWQTMLDEAGYPKTPGTRRTQIRPPASTSTAKVDAPGAPAQPAAPAPAAPPAADGGYPKP
jgi:glutaredoxin